MAAWTFREKKNNNKVESFPTLFLIDVYTHMDNRQNLGQFPQGGGTGARTCNARFQQD